jgi:endonuclease YncB( thermonuclease family)
LNDRPASYVRNHDGDSVTVMIDQGFYDRKQINIRLANVWAPKLDQEGGTPVKYFVQDWFARHMVKNFGTKWPFLVVTHMTSANAEVKSFDRFVADVMTRDGKSHLNSDLMHFIVDMGYAGGTGAPTR